MAREAGEEATVAYKTILADIIDNRPSGTRQRLATALGKHRSFVTQITSPTYATPLPSRHLATIFRVCHMSAMEQERFLNAYEKDLERSRFRRRAEEPPVRRGRLGVRGKALCTALTHGVARQGEANEAERT